MRVLFNGVTLLKPKTGIAHAAANLHAALVSGYPTDTFWLYPGAWVSRLAGRVFRSPTRVPTASVNKHPGRLKQLARSAIGSVAKAGYAAHFQAAARVGRFDLYHEPNFVPFRTGLPVVVTVFDLSVLLFPQWHPAERVKAHEHAYTRGIERADHVIVGTEAVRAEVQRYLGLSPDRVTAMLCGVGPQFRPQPAGAGVAIRAKHGLPTRYTLYVGTIEPRKNVGMLLRAFCDLPAAQREACPLVLAGGWGWKTEAERELFRSEAKHKGVRHIGYVPDEDLPALYAGADALLYPSFYEGFGMPPVEAMACGTAAVTSTADAVREVVGRNALTIDANDLAGWREVLARVADDPEFLSDYRRRGPAHAATFTWDACARVTYGVYRKVLGREQPPAIPSRPRAAA
ncbi:glycosyltransferase family 4 protein [Frigoriglobus tundricola]|uniref:GT4 family glycosyltransferase n=1 Tax=Frigoriglobus tundricola TaxID=2774151 RepID=A0A6M5Z5Q3_9BACT|nr:glycosyltransferase family 1 protein [Frigoriglobus tundricola]QJX00892.1 GT4 family glycosyltransferase [Frigoriglobus tundricola]